MQNVIELLSKLISIPSINPMGRVVEGAPYFEERLTAFLEDWLRPLDVELRRQPVRPERENLLATYHAPNPTSHILLEVHQDTVPTDGMVIDPFRPVVEGNRLYGRGACDNKGPMTAMLLALKRLSEERPAGSASVTLALTVDEEHTFMGASELVRSGMNYDVAVVAEPTGLDIVVAHKGIVRWEIHTPGVACHSSAPERGVNAVYRMAPVLSRIARYAEELNRRRKDPMLGGPTISVGRIDGGTCVNVVPDFCRIEIDRRLIPGETPDEAYRDANDFIRAGEGIDFPLDCRPPWIHLGPMGNDKNGSLTEAFGRSVDRFRSQHEVIAVPFGTDAAVFAFAGVPSIVFGPGGIAQAHTKDEWVPLDEIGVATEILFDFCARGGVVMN
ncbi:MAG: M20 family metallopeptidase [Planctomycetota bacterium]